MKRLSFCLILLCLSLPLAGLAQSSPENSGNTDTNAQESLRAYLQLQEQLHANQLAIEQTRKEADEAAVRNAEALAHNTETLAERLKSIEDALTTQRGEELRSIQSSSRLMLTLSGGFALLGISAILLMAFLQWRAVSRLAEISAAYASWRSMGPTSEVKMLEAGERGPTGAVRAVNAQLATALAQLEKRMLGLEERTRVPLQDAATGSQGANGHSGRQNSNGADSVEPGSAADLLARGQELLEQDKTAQALALFDQVIQNGPGNADAHVRRGCALEKLGRVEEALKSYDRALEIDASLTIAYLHKGGLLNRTEKFAEALECYERALRTQEKQIG